MSIEREPPAPSPNMMMAMPTMNHAMLATFLPLLSIRRRHEMFKQQQQLAAQIKASALSSQVPDFKEVMRTIAC